MKIDSFERKMHPTLGDAWVAGYHNHHANEPCEGELHSAIWIFDRYVLKNYDGTPADPTDHVRRALEEMKTRVIQLAITFEAKGVALR